MNQQPIVKTKDEKHRGTVLFVIGILIALFFGGAVRTFLSPHQVENYIRQQVEDRKPKFDVEFSRAQLTLSRGWVPRLGLQLNDLQLKTNNRCLNPIHLTVDEVYIPVHIFRFLDGEIQFLQIEFGNIDIVGLTKPETCLKRGNVIIEPVLPRREVVTLSGIEKNSFDDFMEKFNSFVNNRWSKELENTRKWLTGVSAEKITFRLDSAKGQAHVIRDFHFDAGHEGASVNVNFVYSPDQELIYYQPLQDIQVHLEVDEDLMRLNARSGYKEGRWVASGELLLDSNQFQLRSDLKTVPVAEVFHGFSKKGVLPDVHGSRPIWLTCNKSLKGSLLDWSNAELEVNECLISGELGSIRLSKSSLKPFKKPMTYKPFKVQLTRFSLENLLDAFDKEPPFNIFHQLGFVTGEITFAGIQEINFLGSIEDISLVFFLNGKKEYQKISEIQGELMFRDNRFSGQVTSMNIDQGEFQGKVSLNLDRKFREGLVQASVSQLELHPEILQLLQLEGISHFEVYGQGEVQAGNIVTWNGNIGFPYLEDNGLKLSTTKFRSIWREAQWKGVLTSKEASISSSHPLFKILYPLYLEENAHSNQLNLKDLETEIKVNSERFQWIRAKAWDKDKDIVFATEGEFDKKGQLKGEIIVDFPVLKLLRWNIEGSLESPVIKPSVKMLKELAKKKPELSAPTSIEFVSEKFYLPKAFQGGASESLKKIRNTVIDSARKILPSGTGDSSEEK